MISAGQNIRAVDDPLQKLQLLYFYYSVKNPRPDLAAKVRQLQIALNMDESQYRRLKCTLPYVVCGHFLSNIRRTENFSYTEYFILDIDHISSKGFSVKDLREKIQVDSRVVMTFLSPSQDGLKAFFKLSERMTDAGLYSIFYKIFASQFAKQYGLEQVIDAKTSDVTRACFFSVDPDAYFNEKAELVDASKFVDANNTFELFQQKKEVEKEQKNLQSAQPQTEQKSVDPGKETMDRIRGVLNPNALKKPDKPAPFVPKVLVALTDELKEYLEGLGIQILSMTDISYGRQILAQVGLNKAQVNVFYGKHGFSVVRTNKCGTSADLAETLGQLVEQFIEIKRAE